jgi:pimeloyl-ACP methyl ester carboxylesterase
MSHVTSQDGTTIAFDSHGDGPPVILVGGAFQYRVFDPPTVNLAKLLGEHFTVIHYDRRGRGDSTDTAPYAVEREIEDIQALIEHVGGSASLYGMSSGSVLALDAARELPVTKLAVYEPPFIVGDSRPPLPSDYFDHLVDLVNAGKSGDAVELFLTQGAAIPAEFVTQMRGAPMWPGFEAVAHTLVYDATLMGDGSVPTDRWTKVTIPTLVAVGGASDEGMRKAADALVDVLPNARLAGLEGQTHDVAPDVLAPVLVDFYQD